MRTAATPYRPVSRPFGQPTQFVPQRRGQSPTLASQSAVTAQPGQPQSVSHAMQQRSAPYLSTSGPSMARSSGSGFPQALSQDVAAAAAARVRGTGYSHVRTLTPPRREITQNSNIDNSRSHVASQTRPTCELTPAEQAAAAATGAAVTPGFGAPTAAAPAATLVASDKAAGLSGPSSEFVKLVRSLEERVELMAQMQRARAQLKDRMEAIDMGGPQSSSVKKLADLAAAEYPVGTTAGTSGTATSGLIDQPGQGTEGIQFGVEEIANAREEVRELREERDTLLVERETRKKVGSKISQENGELFVQLRTQGQQISELRSSLQELQQALQSVRGNAADRDLQLQEAKTSTLRCAEDCQQLRQQLLDEHSHFEESQKTWQADRLRLERQLQLAAREGPGSVGLRTKLDADVASVNSRSSASTSDAGLALLHEQMTQQTQRLGELERSLNKRLGSGKQSLSNVPPATPPMALSRGTRAGLSNAEPMPTRLLDIEGPPSALMRELLPWSRKKVGLNIALSEDGYTATRTKGCRQSVVLGQGPLERGPYGWYFEVEVRETVLGWVGGLGIGVTLSDENQLRRVPDKAWRLPRTYILGYWGRVFCDGREYRAPWHTDEIQEGSVVGLLVTDSGELLVFVDRQQKVRIDAKVPVGSTWQYEFLYPVVDVFAATQSVVLRKSSAPPPPPWSAAEATLDPPDSPASSLRSGNVSNISLSLSSPGDK